ncbi:MAG TPA: DUF1722 domain-containing protein [Epsilonproteobacteria bacterium]|nr:DUF1722 domain-containing protein [Campylobacterota bacterium]
MILGVSACLLGENVRFDGGHKKDSFLVNSLGKYTQFVRFCPEALGFTTPRDSMRLVAGKDGLRVVNNKTTIDVTSTLKQASLKELDRLKQSPLCGIVFKSKSPSCGFGSAKIYLENGFAQGKGDGLFVTMCKEHFPLLPLEEESRLLDPWLRENFVMQIFAYSAFEKFKQTNPTMAQLVSFHQSYKFLLHSKDELRYRELGRIVGNHSKKDFKDLFCEYERLFKETIGIKSSIKKSRNVLEHMSGFLKNLLDDVEKSTLHSHIEAFAKGFVPLIVPLESIKMFAKKYDVEYLKGQVFLEPYPYELALRSELKAYK